MANTFYLHASKPELVSGLRAVRLYKDVMKDRSDLGVLLGRYEKQIVRKGKHTEVRRTPEKASNSKVIWTHREYKPYVLNGKVHDASIERIRTPKGGTITLFTAPKGDGRFIAHLETGIPKHWDMDAVAAFMDQVKPGQMKSHGSERIDDGSENVLAHRIGWQRPRKGVDGSVDALDPSKGVRIYSGDAWVMSPGAEILVHDITGQAFRVVCDREGPKVVDVGVPDPYERFQELFHARRRRNAAADAAATEGEVGNDNTKATAEPGVAAEEPKPSRWSVSQYLR